MLEVITQMHHLIINMKKFNIILLSVFLFPLGINADEQDTITPIEVLKADSLLHEINRLNGLIEQYKQSEATLNGKLFDCEQTITIQNKKIERLNNYLLFADTIVARLSNDCLRKKYNSTQVNQAGMCDCGDPDSLYTFCPEHCGPFTGQKQALTYIDKIKNTRYYREVYSENWTIPYLNNLIDKCIETIKAFNPKESKELHLLELMN